MIILGMRDPAIGTIQVLVMWARSAVAMVSLMVRHISTLTQPDISMLSIFIIIAYKNLLTMVDL